jgi:hypothetical protein
MIHALRFLFYEFNIENQQPHSINFGLILRINNGNYVSVTEAYNRITNELMILARDFDNNLEDSRIYGSNRNTLVENLDQLRDSYNAFMRSIEIRELDGNRDRGHDYYLELLQNLTNVIDGLLILLSNALGCSRDEL